MKEINHRGEDKTALSINKYLEDLLNSVSEITPKKNRTKFEIRIIFFIWHISIGIRRTSK